MRNNILHFAARGTHRGSLSLGVLVTRAAPASWRAACPGEVDLVVLAWKLNPAGIGSAPIEIQRFSLLRCHVDL